MYTMQLTCNNIQCHDNKHTCTDTLYDMRNDHDYINQGNDT